VLEYDKSQGEGSLKYRQLTFIYFFIALCALIVIWTSKGGFDDFGVDGENNSALKKKTSIEESYFQDIKFFLEENNLPILSFDAEDLTLSGIDSKIFGTNPKGNIFRENLNSPVKFEAQNVKVYFDKKEIYLENDVHIDLDESKMNADKIIIFQSQDLVKATGHVQSFTSSEERGDQVLVTSDEMVYRSLKRNFQYKSNVHGNLKRKKKYEESVQFNADLVNVELSNSFAELKGQVHIIRENFDVYANNGNIYLENYNKKLKYYSLYDDVKLEEKVFRDGKYFMRKAFSEKLEGIISEKRMILTGLPKVFQENDVIKGNKIIIRENIETVEVDDANTNITIQKDD
jgi:lipopolysaccharide export system protein LptA